MNLKKSKEGYMRGFRGRRWKEMVYLKSQKQATKIKFQPTKIFFTVYFHWTWYDVT